MIYTFTGNPSVDYYIKVDDFKNNYINRVDESFFVASGKGINCSKVFELMSIENRALFFCGGFTGKYIIDDFNDKKYTICDPIMVDGTNRVNIKFIGEEDTAINAAGPYIDEKAKKELYDKVRMCSENDYFIVSGSMPVNFTKENLLELFHIINERKAKLVIDNFDLKLEDYDGIDVYLIKPNLKELEEFAGINENDDYLKNIERILSSGIQNVLLSLGEDGCYYAGQYGRYKVDIPNVDVYSTVSCGDCLLAGFIGELQKENNIIEALKWASACGCARANYRELDSLDKIREIYDEISLWLYS